ncbi:MAG: hypothetical protein COA88_07895 [Kordia sp.]|nr:MAG: hypothetical protein COA88_07895 [Kordia sp.]
MSTAAFKSFGNGRKFACYIGVALFSYSSGSNQRSRNKVSHRANKKLKTLYYMAALSAIRVLPIKIQSIHIKAVFDLYFAL